jgi:hypothetical protein
MKFPHGRHHLYEADPLMASDENETDKDYLEADGSAVDRIAAT